MEENVRNQMNAQTKEEKVRKKKKNSLIAERRKIFKSLWLTKL